MTTFRWENRQWRTNTFNDNVFMDHLHNAMGFRRKNFLKVFWSLTKSNPCFNSIGVRLDDLYMSKLLVITIYY